MYYLIYNNTCTTYLHHMIYPPSSRFVIHEGFKCTKNWNLTIYIFVFFFRKMPRCIIRLQMFRDKLVNWPKKSRLKLLREWDSSSTYPLAPMMVAKRTESKTQFLIQTFQESLFLNYPLSYFPDVWFVWLNSSLVIGFDTCPVCIHTIQIVLMIGWCVVLLVRLVWNPWMPPFWSPTKPVNHSSLWYIVASSILSESVL